MIEYFPSPDITVQDVMDYIGAGIMSHVEQHKEEEKNPNELRHARIDAGAKVLMTVYAFCAGKNPEEFLKQYLVKKN